MTLQPTPPAADSSHLWRVVMMIGVVVGSVAFWNSPVLLPFKLLSVMGHETGHALASLLVGGSVDRVTVEPTEAGQCLSRTPDGFFSRVLVYSAGYVGSSVIAMLLMIITFRTRLRRVMLALACVWLASMGLLYGRDLFTLAFCLGMAALFGVGAKFLPDKLVGVLNLFIATFTAVYAAADLKDDLWNSAVRAQSDATLLANLTIVPAIVWAAVWTLTSLVILAFGAWISMRAPRPKPL